MKNYSMGNLFVCLFVNNLFYFWSGKFWFYDFIYLRSKKKKLLYLKEYVILLESIKKVLVFI